jgi:hypothetical protein
MLFGHSDEQQTGVPRRFSAFVQRKKARDVVPLQKNVAAMFVHCGK